MIDLKDRYRRFKEWRQQPHQVAPLSEEMHECTACGTHFEGNYCPRCGQSAKIGRYSFKNAFQLYLDVWGLGNRGMFRTIRDLILRPGYMIRDYLRGMQMAYFPPFKMFFLLLALSLLVDSGLNIQFINREKQNEKEAEELMARFKTKEKQTDVQEKKAEKQSDNTLIQEEKDRQVDKEFKRRMNIIDEWFNQHLAVMMLAGLLIFSVPLYLLFHQCPAIPDLRLSECFVAMVYITNMLIIYALIPSFLCFSLNAEIIYNLLALLLVIIPIKQLSGYSYWSTIWRLFVAVIPFIVIVLLSVLALILYVYISSYHHITA